MIDTTFSLVRRDLYGRYGHTCSSQVIDTIFDEVIAEHESTATVTDFLPVLVAREASERIEHYLWTHGDVGTPRKRILFAHRGDAAVAVLAAGLARRLSDNAVVATVADTHPENRENSLIEWIIDERGLDHASTVTRRQDRTLDAPDVVVYLGMDEEADLPGRRYVHWHVASTEGMDIETGRRLADELEDAVGRLLADLDVRVVSRDVERLAA